MMTMTAITSHHITHNLNQNSSFFLFPNNTDYEQQTDRKDHHGVKKGSYQGLTGPSQAMLWLAVAIAGGMVVASPAGINIDLSSLSLNSWNDISGPSLGVARFDGTTFTLDAERWNQAMELARTYHLNNIESFNVLSAVPAAAIQWATQAQQTVAGNFQEMLRSLPTSQEWQQVLDTTKLQAMIATKATTFQANLDTRIPEIQQDVQSQMAALQFAWQGQLDKLQVEVPSQMEAMKSQMEALARSFPQQVKSLQQAFVAKLDGVVPAIQQRLQESSEDFQNYIPQFQQIVTDKTAKVQMAIPQLQRAIENSISDMQTSAAAKASELQQQAVPNFQQSIMTKMTEVQGFVQEIQQEMESAMPQFQRDLEFGSTGLQDSISSLQQMVTDTSDELQEVMPAIQQNTMDFSVTEAQDSIAKIQADVADKTLDVQNVVPQLQQAVESGTAELQNSVAEIRPELFPPATTGSELQLAVPTVDNIPQEVVTKTSEIQTFVPSGSDVLTSTLSKVEEVQAVTLPKVTEIMTKIPETVSTTPKTAIPADGASIPDVSSLRYLYSF